MEAVLIQDPGQWSSDSLISGGPSHPALFAAVMRKAGVAKQLECHGFVMDSPEEAILVAANLYQALLETMKRNKRAGSVSQVWTFLVSFLKAVSFGSEYGRIHYLKDMEPVSTP